MHREQLIEELNKKIGGVATQDLLNYSNAPTLDRIRAELGVSVEAIIKIRDEEFAKVAQMALTGEFVDPIIAIVIEKGKLYGKEKGLE